MKPRRIQFALLALILTAMVADLHSQSNAAPDTTYTGTGSPAWTELRPGPLLQWKKEAGGNGHFYQAIESPKGTNWADAQYYAFAHHGYLATISSLAENNFVFKMTDDPKYWVDNANGNSCGPWLGGYKAAGVTQPDAGWLWVNNQGPIAYFNWGAGQPDNSGGKETRIHYYYPRGGIRVPEWNDCPPSYGAHGFIVEYGSNAVSPLVPPPVSWWMFTTVVIAVSLAGLLAFIGILFFFFHVKDDNGDEPRTKES